MSELIQIREATVRYRYPETIEASIESPGQAARFIREQIGDAAQEHFLALHMGARNTPIAYQIVSIGTGDAAMAYPRDVFQAAVMVGALGIIVAHNHPSGLASPSDADLRVTERIAQAGEILGIKLIDSLVMTHRDWTSIREIQPELFSV